MIMELTIVNKLKINASKSVRILESIVSIGSGLLLGILGGFILGLVVGVGIAMALGII